MKPLIIFSLILLVSCGDRRSTDSELNNVFGPDDREAMTTKQYPWSAVGRLVLSSGASCTGTLVSRDLAITAAHCIVDSRTKELYPGTFRFQPNFRNGLATATFNVERVWLGTKDPSANRKSDWAILRLQGNPGQRFGWLGVADTSVENFPDFVTAAGYSKDFNGGNTAGLHRNCSVRYRDVRYNLISHDCDMGRGASGGPLVRLLGSNLTIYGIMVSERRHGEQTSLNLAQYNETYANQAIPTAEVLSQLKTVVNR